MSRLQIYDDDEDYVNNNIIENDIENVKELEELEVFLHKDNYNGNIEIDKKVGFIILRNVINQKTNMYWKLCYKSIRKYYPDNKIMIIDDNSNYNFVDKDFEKEITNTVIFKSEYPGRGELLPYYYYLLNNLFEIACILHDSVFINSYIDFNIDKYKMLWSFNHEWDNETKEKEILKNIKNDSLHKFYENKNNWVGCFGCMTIITHDFVKKLNDDYDIINLLNFIVNRDTRMSFERIFACMLQNSSSEKNVYLGNIHKYCKWGVSFENINTLKELPIIKIWSGR